jgi:hypothetical protein
MRFLRRRKKPAFEGGGLVIFEDVQDAMAAEKALKKANYAVKLVAPPPELRSGCDLALEINLVERPGIERVLGEESAAYVGVAPLKLGTSPLLEIVRTTDFGDLVMVRAGNMKLSFDKATGVIVNVSGGGCPDIPYLHSRLRGERLTEAARPRDVGFTLCALMLDRALEEGLALWEGGGQQ